MRNDRVGRIFIFLLTAAVVMVGGIDQGTKDALKVGHILRTIERQSKTTGEESRSTEVTEAELNHYIAYRLKQERSPVVKGLTVDLLEKSHVRGDIRFDAKGLNLDVLLGENLKFDFTGIFHTRDGAAKLDLISLALNGQPVNPQVLDFVLHTAALVYGEDWGTTDDWYDLPKGIKRIVVDRAMATVYY